MESLLLQTSLLAAFVAGIVALFAPCCITFLLPAYLGSVFKEKEKVLFMTLVFGLGIFLVMLPAVLGVALLSKYLFIYHNQIYTVGGLVMIIIALMTFLGVKMPFMLHPGTQSTKKPDIFAIFTLGIFSGVTSACCAPVLLGILTLTFLSPSFLGALSVGAVYVLGMVTPLLIFGLFLSGKMEKFIVLRKPVMRFHIFNKEVVVILSNLIASIVFLITGIIILYFNMTGQLGMGTSDGFTQMITSAAAVVDEVIGRNIFINLIFLGLLIFGLYKLIKKA